MLVGLTQAEIVIPLVRSREFASATVTVLFVLLNWTSLPNCPEAHGAFASVAPLLFPDESDAVMPLPSLNPSAITRPVGAALLTTTPTAADVERFPPTSRAMAVN